MHIEERKNEWKKNKENGKVIKKKKAAKKQKTRAPESMLFHLYIMFNRRGRPKEIRERETDGEGEVT